MDLQAILDFFRAVSWQLVIIVAFVVLIIYRGPIGELIPKIRRGEISRDKEKGLTFSLETAGNEPQPTETDKKINNIKQNI